MIALGSSPDPAARIHAGRHELACDRCGARVLVTKNSRLHTSVQWTLRAEACCPELGDASGAGRAAPRAAVCTTLRDSIERAAQEGRIPVGPQERS